MSRCLSPPRCGQRASNGSESVRLGSSVPPITPPRVTFANAGSRHLSRPPPGWQERTTYRTGGSGQEVVGSGEVVGAWACRESEGCGVKDIRCEQRERVCD